MKPTYEELEKRCAHLESVINTIAEFLIKDALIMSVPTLANMAGGKRPDFFRDEDVRTAIDSLILSGSIDDIRQTLLEYPY
ncbi:MAG TPA: hypothetical protein ENI69_02500 [Rhodospirillales bacterium]|nr:hypothetical protein [Rhodospirillales bacterium]